MGKEAKIANLKDVAVRAGVSISTASHVVNHTRFVQPETEARVRNAIEELGYTPNRVARGLRTGSSRTIAVMGISSVDQLFAEVVRGIESRCYDRGYEVFLGYVEYPGVCNSLALDELNRREKEFLEGILGGNLRQSNLGGHRVAEDQPKERDIVGKFLSREVDGLVLNAGQTDVVLKSLLSEIRQPVLLYQRHLPDTNCDSCLADDYGGTRAALERLMAQGHRRIAMLYGFSWESHGVRERFRAWMDVHKEAGWTIDPTLLLQTNYELPLAALRTRELLSLPNPPTAILCWSDLVALSVLDACREAGRSVPGDVSVVGFDDLDFAAVVAPRLSTVRQAKLETGYRIADRLLDRIEGLADSGPVRLVIPTAFVERESTGPVPT